MLFVFPEISWFVNAPIRGGVIAADGVGLAGSGMT
jgi:hypothetical protein